MLTLHLRSIAGLSILAFLYIDGIVAGTFQNEVLKFKDFQQPRIINGTLAELDNTKHQVSIRRKQTHKYFSGSAHICGGSLISENVVLSAAHCVVNYNIRKPKGTFYPANHFIAVMGDLNRNNKTNNTLVFDIVEIVTHVEIFNLATYQSDIVLLILNGTVPASHRAVSPIILNDSPIEDNTLCQATGWGLTENGTESADLLTVDLPFISTNDCREKTLYHGLIREGMFCAGYMEGGKDSCKGDSGGPLVCRGVQAGIISWGSDCARPLLPGVLTDVAFYKDWIVKEVVTHNATLPIFSSDINDHSANNTHVDDWSNDGASHLNCSMVLICVTFYFLSLFKPNKIIF